MKTLLYQHLVGWIAICFYMSSQISFVLAYVNNHASFPSKRFPPVKSTTRSPHSLFNLRKLKTTELLRSVDDSITQVRYVRGSSAISSSSASISSGATTVTSNTSLRRTIWPLQESSWQLMATSNDNSESNLKDKSEKKWSIRSVSFVFLIALLGLYKKDLLLGILSTWKENYSPSQIRDIMVPILDGLNDSGIKGQVIYTLSLLLWTMTVGITTPVETAAGIAFGLKKGIVCNAIGKISGAFLSFVLGRYFFYQYVHKKLQKNELLELVEESIEEHPLGVSLMVRFSPLPEFAKNFGLSILKVRARWFAAAIILHGLPFTCLWTCLGAETASVMRGAMPSSTFKLLMTGVTWFGFLVSPTMIGLWINSLREKKKQRG